VSAAKQNPHRPGLAPALGLRAGADGLVILSQTDFGKERSFSHSQEVYSMFLRLAKIKSRIARSLAPPRLRPPRSAACNRTRLAVESLEDRCLLSSYNITDIGPITALIGSWVPRHPSSGINNASTVQVAGLGANGHAYLWDSIHGMQDIGTVGNETNSVAFSINNAGQVVGFSWTDSLYYKNGKIYQKFAEDGFLWTSSRGMSSLGPGIPTGINNSGEITGDTGAEASLWGGGHQWIQLGILPGGNASHAIGIDDYGQVVGYSDNGNSSFYRGFLWTPSSPNSTSGSMIDLGTLFSSPGGSWASAINRQGWVTGRSDDMNAGGAGHAYVWVPSSTNGTAGSMTDLGTLAVNSNPALSQSEGNAINSSGVVVGDANPASATGQNQIVAVVWQPGTNGSYTISDLNNLIPAGTGWTLTRADAVNDSGQIVVEATNGTSHDALLLTPAGPSTPFARAANCTRQTTGARPLPASSAGPAFAPLPAPPLAGSGIAPPTVGVSPRNGPATPSPVPLPLPSFSERLAPADQADPFRFDSAPSKVARAAADRVFAGLGAEPLDALAGADLALAGWGSDDLMPAAARA
jgi:probable HAF family extracellular repeat protein